MFILASKSPRRHQLIKKLVDSFEVIVSDVDELKSLPDNYKLAEENSKLKAYSIYKDHKEDTVLACDTIVIIDNIVLGKPKTEEDAKTMLKMLSGKCHTVVSGYTFINKDIEINRSVISYVYFNELSDELISRYVATGSPMDKAGAYGVQDNESFNIINHVEGSIDNVMGLPTEDIANYCFNK